MPTDGGGSVFGAKQFEKITTATPDPTKAAVRKSILSYGDLLYGANTLVRDRWREFDIDDSGELDKGEFKLLLLSLGLIEDNAEADVITYDEISRAEQHFKDQGRANGKLSYTEFLIYYKRFCYFVVDKNERDKNRSDLKNGYNLSVKKPVEHEDDPLEVKELFALWRKHDENEVYDVLAQAQRREEAIHGLFLNYDKDGNHEIDEAEFKELLQDLNLGDQDESARDVIKRIQEEVKKKATENGTIQNVLMAEEMKQEKMALSFNEFVHVYNELMNAVNSDKYPRTREKEHEGLVSALMEKIVSKNPELVEHMLTEDVLLDQPEGYPGYGGALGKEAFMAALQEMFSMDLGMVLVDHDSLVPCGWYIQKSSVVQRRVYMYRVNIRFDNYRRSLVCQVAFGVVNKLNQINEMIFLYFKSDDEDSD